MIFTSGVSCVSLATTFPACQGLRYFLFAPLRRRRMRAPSFIAAPAAMLLLMAVALLSLAKSARAELTSAFRSDFDEVVSMPVVAHLVPISFCNVCTT